MTQKVLVLGAGLVAPPLVKSLLDWGYGVLVAALEVERAREMVAGHENGEAQRVDLRHDHIDALVAAADLVVSLAPFDLHPTVAKACIKEKRPLVTASYVSPAMQALDEDAKRAGVILLNELGLDPGIDHMSAMRVIDAVKREGGSVRAFRSYCGGLPAPEANDNPFGYKFSWSPRGVLIASRNGARYLLDGQVVEVTPERTLRDTHILHVEGCGDFEAYPNRDALHYIDSYGLEGIETMFRGTLRNIGWCDCIYNYRKLGLLDVEERETEGKTYAQMVAELVGVGAGEELRHAVAKKLGLPLDSLPIANLQWLGMFSQRNLANIRSPLDALGALMVEKLKYRPGERDMIVLFHRFDTRRADGTREQITSSLVAYGIEGGDTAMARTVSLPAAAGARLILEGKITDHGVHRPVSQQIYIPILDELERKGIVCVELGTVLRS